MNIVTRWDQSRVLTPLQEQVIRLFEDNATRDRSGHADLATWAPPVDIYETENELVIKADLPDLEEKDIDVRLENNSLTSFSNFRSPRMVNELFSRRTSMSFSSRSGRSAFITNSFSVSYMSTGGAQVARSACPERSRVALPSNEPMTCSCQARNTQDWY